jgi:negative regulator of replication initiation
MPLEETVEAIIRNLRQGVFQNEQAISQGIVLRLLQELGWNAWDTTHVWPEFQTLEGRRVDFALCNPPTRPAVFVEVKQPGKAEEGIRQALEYAFLVGVPFVVLTDGKTWSFYLPAEQGSFEERRVYKLDLFEREIPEIIKRLKEYLEHSRVASGEALESARNEYRNRNRVSLAKRTIPSAWQELIDKGESLLVELVQDAVESKCGVRPKDEDVLEFFRRPQISIAQPPAAPPIRPQSTTPPRTSDDRRPTTAPKSRAGTIRLLGGEIHVRNAIEATMLILRELAKKDSSFLARCAAHPDNFGRKRAYIARTTEELFPDRPDLRPKHEEITDGWLLNTNVNNGIKLQVVKLACEVAGLRFGHDVMVDF